MANHIGIRATTDIDEVMKMPKDFFAITETFRAHRKKLDIRHQEEGDSTESYVRDIKLIGHMAYPE